MVNARLLGKRASLPALQTRRCDGHPVDPSASDGLIAADGLEALAPEQLAGPGYVFDVRIPIVVMNAVLDERRAGHPKARVVFEPLQQELEIVRLERNIRVKACDDVRAQVLDVFGAGVDALHLRLQAPVAP